MKKFTKYDLWQRAIERAKEDVEIAEQMLKIVDPEFTVWAAHEVIAKREKLNAVISRAKKELTA